MSSLGATVTAYPYSYIFGNGFFDQRTAPFTTPTDASTVQHWFPPGTDCCSQGWETPLHPRTTNAACAVSNDGCSNIYPFWDLYACCNGAEIVPYDFSCMAQCDAVGQTFEDLMTCLRKRGLGIVVCKPADKEIAASAQWEVWLSGPTRPPMTPTTGSGFPGRETARTHGVSVSRSTGAASTVDVVHVQSSKVGIVILALLALGSAVGMLL